MKKILSAVLCVFTLAVCIFPVTASGMSISTTRYIKNYEEYESFLESTQLPDNFVSYDAIKQIGDFVNFSIDPIEPGSEIYKFDLYRYLLRDSSKMEMTVSIGSVREETVYEFKPGNIEESNFNDMRMSNSDERVVYQIDGVSYYYEKCELIAVLWENDGLFYQLFIKGELDSCSDATTFLGKLLFDAGNARKTVDALYNSSNPTQTTEPQETESSGCSGCGGFSVFAGFIVLACAAGAVVLIKKK